MEAAIAGNSEEGKRLFHALAAQNYAPYRSQLPKGSSKWKGGTVVDWKWEEGKEGKEGMRAASVSTIMASLMKYLVEGLAVALVAYAVPQRKLHLGDTAAIALTAAATFAVLDAYAPAVAGSARLGAGFGVGGNLVGFGREGF